MPNADKSVRTGAAVNWQTSIDGDLRTLVQVDGLTIKSACFLETEFTLGRASIDATSSNATNLLGVTRTNDQFLPNHSVYTLTSSAQRIATVDETDSELVLVYREQRPDKSWVIVTLPMHLRSTPGSCAAFGIATSNAGSKLVP